MSRYYWEWDDDVQGYIVYDNLSIIYIVDHESEAIQIVSLLKNEECHVTL